MAPLISTPTRDGLELSNKQCEVLQLVAAGLSNDEIAQLLTISVSGVQRHMTQSFEKLGVSNRTAAVIAAAKLGRVAID